MLIDLQWDGVFFDALLAYLSKHQSVSLPYPPSGFNTDFMDIEADVYYTISYVFRHEQHHVESLYLDLNRELEIVSALKNGREHFYKHPKEMVISRIQYLAGDGGWYQVVEGVNKGRAKYEWVHLLNLLLPLRDDD